MVGSAEWEKKFSKQEKVRLETQVIEEQELPRGHPE